MNMARNPKERLDALEAQLTGPKRVALFGHRAVGKTTLLSMFYREASMGRVPLVRLAAGDAATAEYLGERILRLEAGEPVAGTLAETTMRLKLYRGMTRLELVVKDYQGEHISLGGDEAIYEFFADCDAVFLCLDGEASESTPARQRRQQEIESLMERYIESSDAATAGRPLALLITKYDRVLAREGPPAEEVERLVEACYGMTRHALNKHARDTAVFAVSSYGPDTDGTNRPPACLRPMGLEAPLAWLAERLEAVDRERLEWLFDVAPNDLPRLARCLRAFERRYPRNAAVIDLKRRLKRLKRSATTRWLLKASLAFVTLGLGVLAYDFWGYFDAIHFESGGHPPAAIEARWSRLLQAHPTLTVLLPKQARTARLKQAEWQLKSASIMVAMGSPDDDLAKQIRALKQKAPELAPRIAALEQAESNSRHEQEWKALRVANLAAVENPSAHLASTRKFLRDYPDTPHENEAVALIKGLESLDRTRRERDDRQAIENLRRDASAPGGSLAGSIDETRAFLAQRGDSPYRNEAEALLEQLIERQDLADIEKARQYSHANPTNFEGRRTRYLDYLKSHSEGGRHLSEANAALELIETESDTHLYRLAYDHAAAHSDDVPVIAERLRDYLTANPTGQYAEAAREYLAWWERIAAPADYRVVLRRGRVEPDVGKAFAGAGPDLGVTLWVAGVEYGPSPVIRDSREPIWDHTFDTPIRWKYGDPISIRIVDYDWSPSGVYTITSRAGDKLAMRLLSGTVRPVQGGRTELVFSSSFRVPKLPRPE
jgi:hypothetical protein